jgi:hypothetical protein
MEQMAQFNQCLRPFLVLNDKGKVEPSHWAQVYAVASHLFEQDLGELSSVGCFAVDRVVGHQLARDENDEGGRFIGPTKELMSKCITGALTTAAVGDGTDQAVSVLCYAGHGGFKEFNTFLKQRNGWRAFPFRKSTYALFNYSPMEIEATENGTCQHQTFCFMINCLILLCSV